MMTIKAKPGVPTGGVSRETLDRETASGRAVLATSADELVMVLFPKVTYDEFMKLTAEYGASSTAETINYALKLLRETLDKQKPV